VGCRRRAVERVNEAEHPHVAAQLWRALCGLESGQRKHDTAERAMRLYASVGDARGAADVQRILGFALCEMGRLDEAQAAIEHALAALRVCGNAYQVAGCLDVQATIASHRGDVPAARELYAQALAAFKAVGNDTGPATVLSNLAVLEFTDGHPELALQAASQALEIHARGKNAILLAVSHVNIAGCQIALGDLSAARDSAREGLRLARQVREELLIAAALQHRAPTVEARPANPIACALCGEPVLKRRRRHCEACMPKARREHGLRAIEAARKALAAQTAAGVDPRRSAAMNQARGEAISEGHRRNRSWAREHPGQRDEAWFKREIVPKLDAFTLAEIAAATGLSLAACSRIRAGAKVPHPRHWEVLRKLADS
jgi:tetratricopeptide (TPR) repeat protein